MTLSVTSGTLTVTTGTSGAGVAGSGTSSVTITGTVAQINALLNTDGTSTVSYVDSVGGTKTLTLLIHDNGNTGGGDLSAQDTANIVLDNPPVVDLNGAAAGTGATLGYTENAAATAIAPAGVTTDIDSGISRRSPVGCVPGQRRDRDQRSPGPTAPSRFPPARSTSVVLSIMMPAAPTHCPADQPTTTDSTPRRFSTLVEHVPDVYDSDHPSDRGARY